MELSINFSEPASALVRSGKITIDRFKTPDWDWMINEALEIKPVAVHFTLEAGNGNLENLDAGRINQLRKLTRTPYVNFHLDARGSYYPDIQVSSTQAKDTKRIISSIYTDLAVIVEKFGPEQVIIENSPYRGEADQTMRACIEADVINSLLDDTGCGLLLDISHAIITCNTIGMEPTDYFNRLPVNRLKELHFAGIQRNPVTGRWTDHLSIQDEDWKWLDWVLERVRGGDWSTPWLLAFEYGGVGEPFEWRSDPQVMAEQVPLLYERVHQLYN